MNVCILSPQIQHFYSIYAYRKRRLKETTNDYYNQKINLKQTPYQSVWLSCHSRPHKEKPVSSS